MKKTILSIAALLMTSGLSMAQFTYVPNATTPTGLTFTANAVPSTGYGRFYNDQPNNNGTTFFLDNACSVDPATGDVGGFDGAIHDASTGGGASGVTFFGGDVRNVFYGAPCTEHIPSVGFSTSNGTPPLATNGLDIDLSDPANQIIQFDYKSQAALSLQLQLFDGAYNTKLVTVPVALLGDNAYHTKTINFSSSLIGASSTLTDVRQVSLLYNSTVKSGTFVVSLANIKLGSALVTGINNSTSVANANLFPNPSTGTTTISGELKSVADVKITLVDMLGQEVKVITEERTSTINTTFDVSTLKKGIYSVVTNIDGAPSKSQMLVVR